MWLMRGHVEVSSAEILVVSLYLILLRRGQMVACSTWRNRGIRQPRAHVLVWRSRCRGKPELTTVGNSIVMRHARVELLV
jgi:hypothetical protein